MVLIPKREEFSDAERIRLWWGRDDYAAFRQVLIDWKRANAHRISHSDNILSINLSDIDEEEEVAESMDTSRDAPAPLEPVPSSPPDYNYAHEEAAAAADATAQAAAVVVAAAQAAAEAAKASAAAVTSQANAAAAAAAAGAATAAEVAAMEAEELEREQLELCTAQSEAAEEEQEAEEEEEEQDRLADAWEVEVAVAKAMSAAVAAAGGGVFVGAGMPTASSAEATTDEDGVLSDIAEGHEGREDQEEPRIGACPEPEAKKTRSSFTMSMGGSAGRRFPNWSPEGGSNGTFPLRRAFTQSGESSSPPAIGVGRLKAVPLSESQATTESLRAWRKGFDARLAVAKDGDDDGDDDDSGGFEEDRARATSLQQQTRNYAQLGRATALVMSRTKWASDVGCSGDTVATAAAAAPAAAAAVAAAEAGIDGIDEISVGGNAIDTGPGGESGDSGDDVVHQEEEQEEEEREGGEKLSRTLSDQEWSASRRSSTRLAAPLTGAAPALSANPVMAAFERERKEAVARQAEIEEAQVARASAMVRAAKAAAAAASAVAEAAADASGTEKSNAQPTTDDDDWQCSSGQGGRTDPSILQLGLNDAPGSAAAASAVGLRMAADGVSNLSLRSKDSVENLQKLGGEHSWGPVALSSSA